MKIPLSKIGVIQEIDVRKSSPLYGKYARVCHVINSKNWHGDMSSARMAQIFGGTWEDYDTQFVVQVAGCPLNCPYCYVDNKEIGQWVTADLLIDSFCKFKRDVPSLNVIHLCGGMPAQFPEFWPELRNKLDQKDEKIVILSDTVFVENFFYNAEPWKYINLHHFAIAGCLKGTTRDNFYENTGHDLFAIAMRELRHYASNENFWMTLINFDPKGLPKILDTVSFDQIDFLKVVDYEVVKARREHRIC